MRLTNLADVLRAAGLDVVEVPGWQDRGVDLTDVLAIICHHTAGPATGNYPSLATVRDGRPDVPGPLSQCGLGRDGTWYVIAAGRANHAGITSQWWQTSSHTIGIEAEAQGEGQPSDWPDVQMRSYERGVAALAEAFGVPNDRVLGHKEIAAGYQGGPVNGRKIDPSFDMDAFRARVRNPTTSGGFMADLTEQEKNDFLTAVAETRKLAGETHTIASETRKKLVRLEEDEETRHLADLKRHRALAKVVAALDLDLDEATLRAELRAALKGVEITLTTKET